MVLRLTPTTLHTELQMTGNTRKFTTEQIIQLFDRELISPQEARRMLELQRGEDDQQEIADDCSE